MSGQVGLIAAFGAGLVSFLSPCVLPLIPGYISFVSGVGIRDLGSPRSRLRDVLLPAALFVLGFTAVFVVLGVSASLLGTSLAQYKTALTRVGGVVIFLFGFFMLGIVRVPWLYREARFDPTRVLGKGLWAAPLVGMAFGFGWTPCVGPILGSILMLAAQQTQAWSGLFLLLAYSAGLGVPFLLVAALLGKLTPLLRWLNRHSLAVSRVAGVVLMLLGAAMATNTLHRLVSIVSSVLPFASTG